MWIFFLSYDKEFKHNHLSTRYFPSFYRLHCIYIWIYCFRTMLKINNYNKNQYLRFSRLCLWIMLVLMINMLNVQQNIDTSYELLNKAYSSLISKHSFYISFAETHKASASPYNKSYSVFFTFFIILDVFKRLLKKQY